jgi:biotin-dependent carboxylase-like uncharacterized protein
MIEIRSATPMASIQDLGRFGSFRFGVSICGAMDRLALAAGNALLGNPDGAAGIEIPAFPFEVRFLADLTAAVTGADCAAELDGRPLPPWWAFPVKEGQVLTLRTPASGVRGYLLVSGGIDVPILLGSRSTQLRGEFGGHCGRTLRQGDTLGVLGGSLPGFPEAGFGAEPPHCALPLGGATPQDGTTVLRVIPAAEYPSFDDASQQAFWDTAWKITPQCSRAGYRLAGPTLSLSAPMEMRSHGLVPGVIQAPAGGTPIIQTADSQTTGGYPKIATIIEADLWRLGQARLGSTLKFVETTYEEAVAALDTTLQYLGKVRSLAEAYRAFLAA